MKKTRNDIIWKFTRNTQIQSGISFNSLKERCWIDGIGNSAFCGICLNQRESGKMKNHVQWQWAPEEKNRGKEVGEVFQLVSFHIIIYIDVFCWVLKIEMKSLHNTLWNHFLCILSVSAFFHCFQIRKKMIFSLQKKTQTISFSSCGGCSWVVFIVVHQENFP